MANVLEFITMNSADGPLGEYSGVMRFVDHILDCQGQGVKHGNGRVGRT